MLNPIFRRVGVFKQPLYDAFGNNAFGYDFARFVVSVFFAHSFPEICVTFRTELQNIVKLVAVVKPTAVEVTGNIPVGLEETFRSPAHKLEPFVYCFKARIAAIFAAADIVNFVPETAEFAVYILFDEIAAKQSAVVVGNPFQSSVPNGVEH